MGPVLEGESGRSAGTASTYTIMYKTDSGGSRGVTQGAQPGSFDDLEGWDAGRGGGAQEEGDLCIVMADSPCMAEANPTL